MKSTYTRGAPKTAQHIKNLEQLLILWLHTPSEAVITELWDWEQYGDKYPCGAVACLGGHAQLSGFFPGLTVYSSHEWFGDDLLFVSRLPSEAPGTDWEVAHRRILKALETKEQT